MEKEIDPLLEELFSEVVRLQGLIHDYNGIPEQQRLFTTWEGLKAIYRNTGMTPKQQLESNHAYYRNTLKERNIEP